MKRFFLYLWVVPVLMVSACSPENPEGGTAPSLPQGPSVPQEPSPIELSVMSFNIKVDGTDDKTTVNGWGSRKDACVQVISEYAPAIIGFQEANYTNQWSWLKTALSDRYDGYGLNRDTGTEAGTGEVMGILYDKNVFQLLDKGTFWLSETPDQASKGWGADYNRTATWSILLHKETGRKICYINTHLDHQSVLARINGMALINKRFGEYNPDGHPQILTGDFNTTSDNFAFRHIEGTMKNTRSAAPEGMTDNHTTYNNWKTTTESIIDHIYVSKDIEVLEYATIAKKIGQCEFVSDHYPIISRIRID